MSTATTTEQTDAIRTLTKLKASAQFGGKGLEKLLADLTKANADGVNTVEEFYKSDDQLKKMHECLAQYFDKKESMLDGEVMKYVDGNEKRAGGKRAGGEGVIDQEIERYEHAVRTTGKEIEKREIKVIDSQAEVKKFEIKVAKSQEKFDKFTLFIKSANDTIKVLTDVQKSIEEHDPADIPLMYLQLRGLFEHAWERELAEKQTFSQYNKLTRLQLREAIDDSWMELYKISMELYGLRKDLAGEEAELDKLKEELNDLVSNRGQKLINKWYPEQAFELRKSAFPADEERELQKRQESERQERDKQRSRGKKPADEKK